MVPLLDTDRLLLRPLACADAAETQQLFPHWEVVKLLAAVVPWPYPADGALRYYREVALPAVERGEEWHWTLRLRDAPEQLIGAICLSRGEEDNRGFWLGQPWQRRGLMTEAVAAVNDYWFNVLGARVMRTKKAAANLASRRISERTGMRLVGVKEHDFVCGRLPAELWEITGEEWEAWKKANPAGGR